MNPHAPTHLDRIIIETLAYFDLFSYPLTPFELWKWGIARDGQVPTLATVITHLSDSTYLRDRIGEQEGMIFCKGREEIVTLRKTRYLIAERKFRRVQKAVRFFRFLPFIRAIAVCNTLSYANARDEGDIDLLILTVPGKIWTTRMFATGLAALCQWRPTRMRLRDSLCLSFYLADSAVSLRTLLLRDRTDLYFRYWLDQLVPVFGDVRAIERLQRANAWAHDILPHAYGNAPCPRRVVPDRGYNRIIRRMLEWCHGGPHGRVLERAYCGWQMQHLPKKLKELANTDTRVVLNDTMLKFHTNDRRADFASLHESRIRQLLAA
jgi:hypothetical protein